jgi:hypothetical protein
MHGRVKLMREWCQKSTFLYIFRIASMCYETRGHVWQGCHMADFFYEKMEILVFIPRFLPPCQFKPSITLLSYLPLHRSPHKEQVGVSTVPLAGFFPIKSAPQCHSVTYCHSCINI